MPTLVRQPSSTATMVMPAGDAGAVVRGLNGAYARERLEEVIRAIAEDALSPTPVDILPWHDEARFEDDLREAVREITDTTNGLLTERLTDLLESAPPRLVVRLASTPRFSDQA
jgi:hypothetical protein